MVKSCSNPGKRLVFKSDDRKGRDTRVFQGFQSRPEKVSYTRDSVVEFLFTLPRVVAQPGGGAAGGGGTAGGGGAGGWVCTSGMHKLNAVGP
jgi:hypothetical protein